jgi:hypothetical protein
MDGISDKLVVAIELGRLRVEGDLSSPPERYELLLHLVADISLRCQNLTIYEEESFPVVELTEAWLQWKATYDAGQDFEFYSMESADGPLIWFRQDEIGYVAGSIFQRSSCSQHVSQKELEQIMDRVCDVVRTQSIEIVGFDALERVCMRGS